MWASGSYPTMVETFLLPLGPRLVDALGIGAGDTVLDVAAGTGNAALPAARRGADVTASDLTPELLEAGRSVAEAEGARAALGRGRRRAPAVRRRVLRRGHVRDRRDVRPVPSAGRRRAGPRLPPGRQDRPAELDARGHDRLAVPHDRPVRAAAPGRRAAPAAVGRRGARPRAVRRPRRPEAGREGRARGHRLRRPRTTTASTSRRYYGPTIAARANAARTAARRSSTPPSTRSATSGTAAPATPRGSRWSTCSPSARGADPLITRAG